MSWVNNSNDGTPNKIVKVSYKQRVTKKKKSKMNATPGRFGCGADYRENKVELIIRKYEFFA